MPPGQQAMMNAAKIATPAGASALPPPIQQAETPGDVVSAEQQAAEAEKLEQQRRSELDKKDQEIHKLQGEIQQAKLDNEREKIRAEQKEREMQMQADLQKREQAYLYRMRQEQKALDQKQNNFAVSEAKHKAQLEKDTAAEQVKLEQAKSKALMDIAKQESDRYIKTTEDAKRTADAYFDQQKKELEAARSAVSPALMSQMQGAVKSIQGLAKLRQKSAVESVLPKSANYKPTVQESKDLYAKARGMSLADMEKARIQADVAASNGQNAVKNQFLRDFYAKRLSEAVPSREYYGHKGDAKLSADYAQHKGLTRNGAGTQALRDIYTGENRPWYDNGKSDWLSKIGYGAGKALDWWFIDPIRQTGNSWTQYMNAIDAARARGESLGWGEHLANIAELGFNAGSAVGAVLPGVGAITRGTRAVRAAANARKAFMATKAPLLKATRGLVKVSPEARAASTALAQAKKTVRKAGNGVTDAQRLAVTNAKNDLANALNTAASVHGVPGKAYTSALKARDEAKAAYEAARSNMTAVKGLKKWDWRTTDDPLFWAPTGFWGKAGKRLLAVPFPTSWGGAALERALANVGYNHDDPNVHWLATPFYRPDYTDLDEETRQYLLQAYKDKTQDDQMRKSGAAEPTPHAQAVNDYATRSRGVTSTAYEGRPEWAKWVEFAAPFVKQLTGGMIDVTPPTSVDGPKPHRVDLNPSLVGSAVANPFGHLQRGGRNAVPLYNYLRAKKRELEPSRGEQHVNDRHRMNYGVGVR